VFRALTQREPPSTDADMRLYFAIVDKAFRLSRRRWPTAQLHLISWDIFDKRYARDEATFHKGLEAIGLKVHFIDQILPGYVDNPLKYSIHRLELHPNSLAHQMVAEYLAEHVLNEEPTSIRE
jgi:hypothetical protein